MQFTIRAKCISTAFSVHIVYIIKLHVIESPVSVHLVEMTRGHRWYIAFIVLDISHQIHLSSILPQPTISHILSLLSQHKHKHTLTQPSKCTSKAFYLTYYQTVIVDMASNTFNINPEIIFIIIFVHNFNMIKL